MRRLLAATVSGFALIALATMPLESAAAADSDSGMTLRAKKGKGSGVRPEDQPALIVADQIQQDRDLNTVTASGHVEIDQGGRILLADNLSYNLKQDVVIASGNVSLTDIDGQVHFADYMELTGDLRSGVIEGIRVLMIDDSRLAALKARRNGQRTVFDKGVYTACQACAEHPDETPLWDVKAKRITHDMDKHLVEYDDAWLNIEGVPVLYTPYFSHADPTVKRKSGFLAPGVINNQIVGTGVRVPYFQVIDDTQDITWSPMYTTKEGTMLAATHRWRGMNGETKTSGSIVNQPASGVAGTDTIGWNIDAAGQFSLNETWRAGYTVQRAATKDYLETYGFHNTKPFLTTRPYLEGFGEKNYASIEAYSFQSLTSPVYPSGAVLPGKSPTVFPLVNYNYVGDPSSHGAYWTFDSRAAAITRIQGVSSRRINTETAWHLPYTANDGEVYNFSARLRADAYNSDHVVGLPDSEVVSTGRVIPQMTMDWRYPFAKIGEHSSQTVTPIVVTNIAPYGGNSVRIPNEDSQDFELDDTNLFSANPFSGYDLVPSGPSVAYGGQYSVMNRGLQVVDAAVGQGYRQHKDQVAPEGTGWDGYLSDIVGRVSTQPSSNLIVGYHYRLDKDSFTLRRSELNATVGPLPFRVSTSYVFYDKLSPTSVFNAREQLVTNVSSQVNRYWKVAAYNTEALGSDAGPLQSGGTLTYEDECLLISGDAGVKHTTVKTFSAGHYLMFRIVFKSLTEFPVDMF